ncbi:7187_t:CDS:1, partial [Diversispora eburnea]
MSDLNEKYPGYEELTSYLSRDKNSFWGFLYSHRDALVVIAATSSTTPRWRDLDNAWATNFIEEARKFGKDLNDK